MANSKIPTKEKIEMESKRKHEIEADNEEFSTFPIQDEL
jgi:hypothetical protein